VPSGRDIVSKNIGSRHGSGRTRRLAEAEESGLERI
jgi:hypothetical protein